jgi:phosphonate metabolism protein PhnN/1,5-bisphosphokinase (PRPP-forming)
MLVLVVGPSGAGKDTLLAAARARLAGDTRFHFVYRVITRPADAGGEAHEATSETDFVAREAAGSFALSWRAHGLSYGIPAEIADDIARGRVVIANVSRGVIADAMRRFPVRVIEITAPTAILAARLAARGREGAADVMNRLARSVALPEGVEIVQVMNDAAPEDGVARFLAALNRAEEDARRS